MGGRAASYFLSDPFAYWHQTCDIHQINRAVSAPRPQLPWHKASSEMFINITLFPMNESCVPSGTCNGSHVNRWDGAFFSALLRAAIASHGSEAKIPLRRRLPLQVGVGVAAAMTWVGRVIAVICGEPEMVTDWCFYVSAPRRASKNWWCPPESGRWWRTDCKMYAPFVEHVYSVFWREARVIKIKKKCVESAKWIFLQESLSECCRGKRPEERPVVYRLREQISEWLPELLQP